MSQYSIAYVGSPTGTIRVAFNPYAMPAAPVHADPAGYKDALNPSTWAFKNLPNPLTYPSFSVYAFDAYTYNVTWKYNLYGNMNTVLAPNGVLLEDGSTLAIPETAFTMVADDTAYTVASVGDRVARIQFDRTKFPSPPAELVSTTIGSALNPRTWFIEELLPSPASPKPYTVLSVAKVDTWTYDILTLEHFPRSNGNQLRLYTAVGGLKLLSSSTFTVDRQFAGSIQKALSTPTAQATRKGVLSKDLANAPVQMEDPIGGAYIIGGTLIINSSGDYESMSGEALVKKLILRRLMTRKGDFFHLPQYGASLGVKETYTRNNLAILAKDIEQQVLLEAEVESAKANVSYSATSGALVIQVRARIRSTGQETAVSMNLPIGSVQL